MGGLRYFPSIGSTNDEALAWAAAGAPDFSLVIADEQTAGRGRAQRRWFTPPGAALALSLILRPSPAEQAQAGRLTGLAAVALVNALQKYQLSAQIKWPNDILLDGKKTAGILVESAWQAEKMDSVIIGIGVNVAPQSVPPAEGLNFPATCLAAAGKHISRLELLKSLLTELLAQRVELTSEDFLRRWEALLAFRGQPVRVWSENSAPLSGQILGLNPDGSLRLEVSGAEKSLHFGEIHLRPL
ncbi:MAG: hypothetical protein Fur0035_24090 [Anaerolineales bacterium]